MITRKIEQRIHAFIRWTAAFLIVGAWGFFILPRAFELERRREAIDAAFVACDYQNSADACAFKKVYQRAVKSGGSH